MLRKVTCDFLYGIGVPTLLKNSRVRHRELTVLLFHRVSSEPDVFWPPMAVKDFARLIDFLAHETCVVPLEALDAVEAYPDKPLVSLSFDDGYRDFYDNALPVLKNYGVPAHHNICPGLIDRGTLPWTQIVGHYVRKQRGRTVRLPDDRVIAVGINSGEPEYLEILNRIYAVDDKTRERYVATISEEVGDIGGNVLMDWSTVKLCHQAGVHIGSHGLNHCNMARIADPTRLAAEVSSSRKRIFEELGTYPEMFAFPSGFYNKAGLQEVERAGYRMALLCGDRVSVQMTQATTNFRILPRILLGNRGWREEALRALGFHQKMKSLIRRTP